jgi:hypothetical protein
MEGGGVLRGEMGGVAKGAETGSGADGTQASGDSILARAARSLPLRKRALALSLPALVLVVLAGMLLSARQGGPSSTPSAHVATATATATPTSITLVRPGPGTPQPAPRAPRGGSAITGAFPSPKGGAPNQPGQVILVGIQQQWLWAYQDGKLVYTTPVTTGRPQLPTPLGVYGITDKAADVMFYSPWGPGSPFYYAPEHVNYAMLFRKGGYYIHDAPWHKDFGPGSNVPHTGPGGVWETGSHGCVEVPTPAGAWLYGWARVGATVEVIP